MSVVLIFHTVFLLLLCRSGWHFDPPGGQCHSRCIGANRKDSSRSNDTHEQGGWGFRDGCLVFQLLPHTRSTHENRLKRHHLDIDFANVSYGSKRMLIFEAKESY